MFRRGATHLRVAPCRTDIHKLADGDDDVGRVDGAAGVAASPGGVARRGPDRPGILFRRSDAVVS